MFVFLLKLVVQYTKYNFVSSMIIGKLGAILGRPVRWNLAQVTHFQHPIIWKWDKSDTFVSLKPTCERYWSSWNHDWCWKTTLNLHLGSPTFKKLRKVTRNDLEINNKWKVCDSLAVRWTVPKDIGNSQEGFLWHLNIPPVPLGEIRSVNTITSFKRPALHKLAQWTFFFIFFSKFATTTRISHVKIEIDYFQKVSWFFQVPAAAHSTRLFLELKKHWSTVMPFLSPLTLPVAVLPLSLCLGLSQLHHSIVISLAVT